MSKEGSLVGRKIQIEEHSEENMESRGKKSVLQKAEGNILKWQEIQSSVEEGFGSDMEHLEHWFHCKSQEARVCRNNCIGV